MSTKEKSVSADNNSFKESHEIIILDDDEETISDKENISEDETQKTKKESSKSQKSDSKKGYCINTRCKNNNARSLKYCPLEMLNYYKIKPNENKDQAICDKCFQKAGIEIGKSLEMLENGIALYTKKHEMYDELLAISDSDDEDPQNGIDLEMGNDDIDTSFIEANAVEVLNEIFEKYNLDKQITDCVEILDKEVEIIRDSTNKIEDEFNQMQKKIDNTRKILYDYFPVKHFELAAVDLSMEEPVLERINDKAFEPPRPLHPSHANAYNSQQNRVPIHQPMPGSASTRPVNIPQVLRLPPVGPVPKLRPRVGDICFALRNNAFTSWFRAKIIEVIHLSTTPDTFSLVKVHFEGNSRHSNPIKQVSGQQIANATPSPVRLPVGSRVIAIYKDMTVRKDSFYPGIVAEPPKPLNNHRYLIFFDDGYTQYVDHHRIRQVMEHSKNVWEDINHHSRPFIKTYLQTYPERPMVRLQVGQTMKTEYLSKWWKARVLKVDVSLVQLYFEEAQRTEWIYRGSSRLAPLYMEIQAAANRQDGKHKVLGKQKKTVNTPYVEYTRGDDPEEILPQNVSSLPGQQPIKSLTGQQSTVQTINKAKKSTTSNTAKQPQMQPQEKSIPFDGSSQSQGKLIYYSPKTPIRTKEFVTHVCNPACAQKSHYNFHGYNPLSIALLSGWKRLTIKIKSRKCIQYITPCGRRIRNMKECHQYLRLTRNHLGVDDFNFQHWVHCLSEFVLDRYNLMRDDISEGVENIPVPCVNYHDHSLPEYSSYSTVRIPTEGVNLNLDKEFLCGCDCEDGCQDKTKCACWKLTVEGARSVDPGIPLSEIGYEYKRLAEPVTTGIYECNSRCKCTSSCLNRVAQHPLKLKLQLFKTVNRGWGIRCLNDIPQGSFICIYAGNLLTEQKANQGGAQYGDEYFAELDYIEVVEKLKEGYEADVIEPEEKSNTPENEPEEDEDEEEIEDCGSMTRDSDEEFDPGLNTNRLGTNTGNTMRTRLSNRKRGSTESAGKQDSDNSRDSKSSNKSSVKIKPDPDSAARTTQELEEAVADWDIDTNHECITISDDEEPLREPSSFAPTKDLEEQSNKSDYKSVRQLYGEDEYCYVMDAKTIGNIGRYLNHSCNPNVFVQNVFVDTHDLRFPWVAFFALTFIRGGTELTWNYNYDVNSVPGKVMYCQCGALECRGRLL